MKIAVYRVDTGAILRVVKCNPDDCDLQAGDGEAWVECDDHFDHTHKIVDGAIVEIGGGANANLA